MSIISKKAIKIVLYAYIIIGFVLSATCQPGNNTRLTTELSKYSFKHTTYGHSRIPLLMANTEMGSLADPLGRGMFETMFNDYWTGPESRARLPGLMLLSAQIANLEPTTYLQQLNITDTFTRVAWSLKSNKPLEPLHYGHIQCNIAPGDSIVLTYKVTSHVDGKDYIEQCNAILPATTFEAMKAVQYSTLLNTDIDLGRDGKK
jgi:hypothetical protein